MNTDILKQHIDEARKGLRLGVMDYALEHLAEAVDELEKMHQPQRNANGKIPV